MKKADFDQIWDALVIGAATPPFVSL